MPSCPPRVRRPWVYLARRSDVLERLRQSDAARGKHLRSRAGVDVNRAARICRQVKLGRNKPRYRDVAAVVGLGRERRGDARGADRQIAVILGATLERVAGKSTNR